MPNAQKRGAPASTEVATRSRAAWADWCRLTAAASIFLFHFLTDYTRLFGARAAAAATGEGAALIVSEFEGWGISFFLVLMGASLVLSPITEPYARYLRRRLLRVLLPLWILAIPYLAAGLAVSEMQWQDVWKVPFWLTGLNVLHPALFFPVSGAWWYVTLAVQWILVAPLVQRLVRARGLLPMAFLLGALQLASLAAISLLPSEWSYLSQGLIVARAATVGFGVVIAHLLSASRTRNELLTTAMAALVLLAVAGLSASLGGTGSPFRLVSYLALAFVFARLSRAGSGAMLAAAAAATYPFYLAHAPIQKYFQVFAARVGISSFPVLLVGAVCAAIIATAVLSRATRLVRQRIETASRS